MSCPNKLDSYFRKPKSYADASSSKRSKLLLCFVANCSRQCVSRKRQHVVNQWSGSLVGYVTPSTIEFNFSAANISFIVESPSTQSASTATVSFDMSILSAKIFSLLNRRYDIEYPLIIVLPCTGLGNYKGKEALFFCGLHRIQNFSK